MERHGPKRKCVDLSSLAEAERKRGAIVTFTFHERYRVTGMDSKTVWLVRIDPAENTEKGEVK